VGCPCPHTGGGSECGGMELDETTDDLVGRPCQCECHDRMMLRPSDETRRHIEKTQFVACTLLQIFSDDGQDTSCDE